MTATLSRVPEPGLARDRPAATVSSAFRAPARLELGRPAWPLLIGAAAVGTVVVGCAYRLSAHGQPAGEYYLVFWIGMLIAVAPVCVRVVAREATSADQLWGILLFGWLTAVPKYLRNPTGPSYHDEYAHWRQAVDVLGAGRLFEPNATIPIVQFFPGTSALTATTQQFTGLSVWTAGSLMILTAHVLGLFAVFVAAETLLGNRRAGAIAALVYGINPSAVYFDTQYAYESVAITFFLWTVALTALAAQSVSPGRRRRLQATAIAAAAGTVVTHHLSTLFLLAALTTVAATVTLCGARARRRHLAGPAPSARTWWIVLSATIGLGALWVGLFARPTLDYLSPYFGSSVNQLSSVAESKGDGGRKLMAANVQPFAEQLITAAAPLLLASIACTAAVLVARHHLRLSPATWGLLVFGSAYFASLPFLLAPSGAEGARRSWGFTYLGIAVLVALVAVHWPADWPRRLSSQWRKPFAAGAFAILLIGNVGGGLNDPYRFPGPFRWGTDTNSASAEARAVAEELNARVGRVKVVSDAYTALAITAYGGGFVAAPSPGFPAWLLTQTGQDPPKDLAGMLVSSEYDYLVVDIRMGEQPAFNGHNYGQGDPLLGQATPMDYLDRLDSVPWARRVISTDHLRVYRLDLMGIATRPQGQP